jgi:hypothetical protein
MGNPNRTVSVQKPSLSLQQPSCVAMWLGDVFEAFAENKASDDPLNVLDLRNPLPRSILPHFLTGEDCQLLTRVRDTILEGATAERCTAQATEWNKGRDDEDWVLLAKGGAHTLTHQDSCGKATWPTVQEGLLGFGWISRPSREEIASWSADPNGSTGGKLRYVVLRPGQTVYFEAGTIHFLFRDLKNDKNIMTNDEISETIEKNLNLRGDEGGDNTPSSPMGFDLSAKQGTLGSAFTNITSCSRAGSFSTQTPLKRTM